MLAHREFTVKLHGEQKVCSQQPGLPPEPIVPCLCTALNGWMTPEVLADNDGGNRHPDAVILVARRLRFCSKRALSREALTLANARDASVTMGF